jgi:hypothetical protein
MFNLIVYNRGVKQADFSRPGSEWLEVLGHAVQSDFVRGSTFSVLFGGGKGQTGF